MKRIYLRWYTPLVEVNQAILAWSFRQKVISKHMIWTEGTRPQVIKAQSFCQNEIKKLDHSLSHILTHLYVLSLQRLMSNWPINGKAIQNQNLHVTNSANQRCSWQYIRSRRNWQDSLGNIQKLQTMQLFTHATSNRFRAVYYKNNKNKGVIFLL